MGTSRSLKPLALVLAVAAHEVVGMPPAAGVLTALGELDLRIGRWDRPRATGGEPERHGESEGANHAPSVTGPAGRVKRAGAWGTGAARHRVRRSATSLERAVHAPCPQVRIPAVLSSARRMAPPLLLAGTAVSISKEGGTTMR